MRVLHFILDGYHPSNLTNILDDKLLESKLSDIGVYNKIDIDTPVVPLEHLKSPRMWFRYYSRHYVTKDEDAGRARFTSLYQTVDGKELIWRRLAENHNVPSYIMPYNQMTPMSSSWMIGKKSSKSSRLINGTFKNWYKTKSWNLTDGNYTPTETEDIMSALMLTTSNDAQIHDSEILDMLSYIDKASSNDEFRSRYYETLPKYIGYITDLAKRLIDGNQREWDERVIPNLEIFSNKYKDVDSFVHLGFGETDAMYHFFRYESMLEDIFRPYLVHCISEACRVYNPDVILITGDHNMINLDNPLAEDFVRSAKGDGPKLFTYVDLDCKDGTKVHTAMSTATYSPLPMFNDHGYLVGGRVFYNTVGESFVDVLKSHVDDINSTDSNPSDDLFPEALYDTLLEVLDNDEYPLEYVDSKKSKTVKKTYESPFGDLRSNSSLGIVLPTYHDDNGVWRSKLVDTFIPNLSNITELNNIKFLVNFQRYSHEEVLEVVNKFNEKFKELNKTTWKIEYVENDQYVPVSMVRIRNDCMMIDPNLNYYMFVDDDTKFNSGAGMNYSDMMNFMDQDDRLGSIMSAGYLGGYNYVGKLKYDKCKWWMTNRGLMLRNINKDKDYSPVYSKSALECVGGLEEIIACCDMLLSGYKTSTYFNNPTSSRPTNLNSGGNPRYSKNEIHNYDIFTESFYNYTSSVLGIGRVVKDIRKDLPRVQTELYYKGLELTGLDEW